MLGSQKSCLKCGHLNIQLPFYFYGPVFPWACERCMADLTTGEQYIPGREIAPGRWEFECSRCKQINARYTMGIRTLMNPRDAESCTLCGTHLDPNMARMLESGTGVSGGFYGTMRRTHSTLMFAVIYFYHAVLGVGIIMLGMVVIVLFTGEIEAFVEKPWLGTLVFWLLMGIGAIGGIALAERTRRRGGLLSKRKG